MPKTFFVVLLAVVVCTASSTIFAQTSSFSYQGHFRQNSVPANGNYYFEFALYDQPTFGSQVGSTLILDPVAVSDGVFTVSLDFGNLFNGSDRYLEIRVRPSGGGPLNVLTPRQLIANAPNALNANSLGGLPAASYIRNSTTQQTNANLNIGGNAVIGGNIGVGTNTPAANLNIVGTQPPDAVGIGTPGVHATDALTILGARGGRSGEAGQGGDGAEIYVRAGDGGTSPQGSIAEGQGGSITLQPGFSGNPDKQGKLLLAPEGGNVGVGTTNPSAKLDVTNNQPGIVNPSPANLPPAAVRGNATATTDITVGVLGVSNSASGIGTVGLTNGNVSTAVLGLSTSETGATVGLASEISSPDGTALDINMPTGGNGYLIRASSGIQTPFQKKGGGFSTKFSVTSAGQVNIDGGLTLNGTFTAGQLSISNSSLQTIGNLQANNVTAAQNVSVGGFLTAPGSTLQINKDVNLNGTLTPMLLSGGDNQLCNLAPTSTLRFCSSSIRYKENVRSFKGGLDIVQQLRPILFAWKENGVEGIGFGAEDVKKVEPRLTFDNANGEVEGVKYSQISAVLVNAINEQQVQLQAQANLIADQAKIVARLSRELNILKRKMRAGRSR